MYVGDIHEPESLRRMGSGPAVWLTPFNRAELAHAIHQQVFRSRFSSDQARLAWNHFEQDCANGLAAVPGMREALSRARAPVVAYLISSDTSPERVIRLAAVLRAGSPRGDN